MKCFNRGRACSGAMTAICAMGWIVAGGTSCDSTVSPQPAVVVGPGLTGRANAPPSLTFTEPNAHMTLGLGDNFVVQWEDTDRDSSALISFWLINTETNQEVLLEAGVPEDDQVGPDSRTFDTGLVPEGEYNVLAIISDSLNPAVRVFARTTTGSVGQNVVLNITPPGQGPQTQPPRVRMIEPSFNQSVAQDDVLRVVVQPAETPPEQNRPYDPDSDVTLYILLDVDLDPNNDDPGNPDPSEIIVLHQQRIVAGEFAQIAPDNLRIDLDRVPPRANGDPYHLRATTDDLTNPRVSHYAVGTISVVQLAAGTKDDPVDLFDIGRTKSGARFYGFNPGANLGSSMSRIGDFDADGLDDFVLVAQFGNPRHVGPVGEAYGIYGMDQIRFGGSLPVNSIGEAVSGVIFEAPPVRPIYNFQDRLVEGARTDGISDVSFITDLTGDGRPEILFGLRHSHGAFEGMDWDPGDVDPDSLDGLSINCYPDFLVNNSTDELDGEDFQDTYLYAGGMAVMVNSQNRATDGLVNPTRLDRTVVTLELVGQKALGFALDDPGPIIQRAANAFADNLGNEQSEVGRISGARFVAGGFDNVDGRLLRQPPREGLFGETVAMLGDQNNDDFDELMFSAPTNERHLADLYNRFSVSTHRESTSYRGSILILPGFNYNDNDWRDKADQTNGNTVSPFLDQHVVGMAPYGRCDSNGPGDPRHTFVPADHIEVYAEDLNDRLGGARSAGDFNQDNIDDIVCGAPLNDRSANIEDSGAVYVLYGRNVFGDFRLADADDPILRPPMLRIRGVSPGDQIGWEQEGGVDVNGDGIDDVFLSSPTTDFGGVVRTTCHGLFYCGDGDVPLSSLEFASCKDAGEDLFCDDRCKAFDYDNDGDVDQQDEDVFVCLFQGGTDCCANLVNNGFVAVVFGGVFIDGDRTINQIGKSDLPGVTFFGSKPGHLAGTDVSSAGDFNRDNFGDILITAPGEVRKDSAGRDRMGVVYLVFGGTHLVNTSWSLEQVGTDDLPGIVFISPYVAGRPNEAAPTKVALLGDINNDGFGDIAIGNAMADFIDLTFPQGPDATDSQLGRRRDTGDVYIVYGNNFGTNRGGF